MFKTHEAGWISKSPGARGSSLCIKEWAHRSWSSRAAWRWCHVCHQASSHLQQAPELLHLPSCVHQPLAMPVGSQGTRAVPGSWSAPAACHPSATAWGHPGHPWAQRSHRCQAQTWCELILIDSEAHNLFLKMAKIKKSIFWGCWSETEVSNSPVAITWTCAIAALAPGPGGLPATGWGHWAVLLLRVSRPAPPSRENRSLKMPEQDFWMVCLHAVPLHWHQPRPSCFPTGSSRAKVQQPRPASSRCT